MRFDQIYNQRDFLKFLGDFLPDDFVEKEEDIIINKSRHKEIIKAQVLGESESLGLSVLEVEHTNEHDPRVALATDAFKILADHWIHRALVVFKSKNSENYRFSYLTVSLDSNEKNKVVRKYSNARRYSFYLGPNAKIRTPEQQLIKKGRIKDGEDLLNRFSLEVVNKEFYLQIAAAFDSLVERGTNFNLSLPSVAQEEGNIYKNFAVRLIGRIMFCWFLKQKKSESGPLISDDLLSAQAVVSIDGYYHGVLEPLFFEVLNTPKDERGVRNALYDQVPYLNGGLFNPQRDDYYELDRGTYVSRHINTLVIQDRWFLDFFNLLETYNFTIDENTVFDQELSVDPEMLGRIFENLLAEINPETGSSERKRTGSFYTPRQIVEYMVDNSLLSYLGNKTHVAEGKLRALISYDQEDDLNNPLSMSEKNQIIDAIADLRILDPACGSGAFPVGMLQKIVYILQYADPDCSLWIDKKLQMVPDLWKQRIQEYYASHPANYIRKLDVIKGSIFGVDIQPIAVEVSRLRCFLTLVVESEIDDIKTNRGIEPLPNLDFKFVCANTLIPAPDLDDEGGRLFGDDFQKNLAIAVDKYFSSAGLNKVAANNEIHKLIDGKVEEKLKHLESLVSYNGDRKMESIRAKAHRKEIDQHSRILTLWSSYKNIFENKSVGFFDPKYFFPNVKDGFDIVIGNPPYINVKRGISEDEKESFKQNYKSAIGQFDLFALFIERGLALTGSVLTYIVPKPFINSENYEVPRTMILDSGLYRLVIGSHVFETAAVESCVFFLHKETLDQNVAIVEFDSNIFTERHLIPREIYYSLPFKVISNEIGQQDIGILKKISTESVSLGDLIEINRGAEIGKSDVSIGKLPTNFKLLTGEDLEKYKIKYRNLYINLDAEDNKKFKSPELYQQEKILIRRVANEIIADYDNEGFAVLNTIYCGVSKEKQTDLKYLTGLLNSRLIRFWFHKIFAPTDKLFPYLRQSQLERIPIRIEKDTKLIANIVDDIKSSSYKLDEEKLLTLERKIDQLVYKLYELTPEEIKIVEGVK